MNRIIVTLTVAVVALFLGAAPGNAQEPNAAPPPPPAPAVQLITHINREGKFVAIFPGTPEEQVEKNRYESGLHIIRLKLPAAGYFILYGDYATTRYDMRTMLNREREGIADLFKLTPASQKTSLLRYGTRDLLTLEFNGDADSGNAHYIWRIFFRDQRVYALGIAAAKETDMTEWAKVFFNSFALIE